MSEQSSRRASSGESARRPSANQTPDSITATSSEQSKSQQSEATRRSSTLPSHISSNSVFRLPSSPNDRPPAKMAKVAIPRLPHKGDAGALDGSRSGGRHRVMHACEPCRARKTKCSGETPSCKHCLDFKVLCVYADGKRDRAKK